jgi:suppressor for copper-sensitivity B
MARNSLGWLMVAMALLGVGIGSDRPLMAQIAKDGRGKGTGVLGSAAVASPAANSVKVSAEFTADRENRSGKLFIKATIEPGWHIYSITQAPGGPRRTRIRLDPSTEYKVVGDFTASPPPIKGTQPEAFNDLVVESHEGEVTWSAPIEFAPGVDPSKIRISGTVNAQPCDANSCYPPEDFAFTATLGQGPAPAQASAAFNPEELRKNIEQQKDQRSLVANLALGFLGGLILNLMPCVLPVIGLKIFSFVQQAGHDRKMALWLNVAYSSGLISVFWVLAALAAAPSMALAEQGMGWGQQFQNAGFNVFIAALVFTMALSFLGVWEFPIPGFAGGKGAARLAEQEGFTGAFFKGVITTLLATPCTGPFMGGALAWAFYQPPHVIFAVFTSVGLGMASPYLLIGAFPKLIRFLPKPGAWMDTFKQVMGFVLLGTVVYLFTFLEASYLVPTLALLFVLWAACWWVARAPVTADTGVKARAWLEAAAMVGAAWIVLFPGLDAVMPERFESLRLRGLHEVMAARLEQRIENEVGRRLAQVNPDATASPGKKTAATKSSDHELPWRPFTTRADFEKLLASGKTVLVDFTADWCATCKTLEALYMNTREVRELVEANGVIPVKADWTNSNPEVTAMLEMLGAKQVPVIAIFPAGNPNNPIRFLNGYTKTAILDALKKAGPSRGPDMVSATAGS